MTRVAGRLGRSGRGIFYHQSLRVPSSACVVRVFAVERGNQPRCDSTRRAEAFQRSRALSLQNRGVRFWLGMVDDGRSRQEQSGVLSSSA